MITGKRISALVAVAVLLALLGSLWMVAGASSAPATQTEYERRLFSGETVTIDIQVDEEDWQSLLDNAQSKEYISADLVINGERFSTVGIRTKGNSSLSQGSANGRYSLQLNPNKYVDGQSFYGLDTMCLNNLMGDASYMKDVLSYDFMEVLGVPAPLRNYAWVTVNGEDHGLFLLLERYDDSFLDRVYGASTGELYNVKMQMGERSDFEAGAFEPTRQSGGEDAQEGGGGWPMMPEGGLPFDLEDMEGMPAGPPFGEGWDGEGMPDFPWGAGEGVEGAPTDGDESGASGEGGRQPGGFGGGMGGFSSGGGSLVYTGDDPANYGSIFNNAVSSKVTEKDQQQVITAIQKLNEGEELERYWDVDEILRYLAAHTFVVNLDSYVSSMQQNYYLLEREGVLSVLPWDYGLAFGGFQAGDASGVVNFAIDTPVSGVDMEDRPLVSQLLAVEEYSQRYHEYLAELVEYVQSGRFEARVQQLDAQIAGDVARDPTAYYTAGEYGAVVEELGELVALRAESVAGQLEGSIPSTTQGQNAAPETLVDASSINLNALGSMGGGGRGMGGNGGGGFGGPFGGQVAPEAEGEPPAEAAEEGTGVAAEGPGSGMPPGTDGTDGGTEAQPPGVESEAPAGTGGGRPGADTAGGQMGGMPQGFGGGSGTAAEETGTHWLLYGVLGLVLAAAICLVALFPRRKWNRTGGRGGGT